MRVFLAALTLFTVFAVPASPGRADSADTVSLLVPVDVELDTLDVLETQSSDDSQVGWEKIVVPMEGTVEQTRASWEDRLGESVLVERIYPLLVGSNEPLFGQQWGLENTGQEGGTSDADIDVRRAWSVATGEGVVVAVIDSGVNASHPDLVGQVIPGRDFVDNDNDPSPVGNNLDESHGTFIAAIIAARVDGAGMAGVAPDARILSVRACSEGSCETLDAINGIHYAVDRGADIINLSFGGPYPRDEPDPPMAAAIEYARSRGVLVVTAAGNDPPHLVGRDYMMVPAELPHANNLAVTATDRYDRIDDFYYGPGIDIAAPGVEIVSATVSGHGVLDGTSFAAPHVAGVAALLKSTDLSMGYEELAARVMAWVDRPSAVSGKVESGRLNAGHVLNNRFTDTRGHTFEKDAKWAADNGVTKGCNPPRNTRFCPNESVTRGQMAAFLRRHLGLPTTSNDHFKDDANSTFQRDINSLAEAGITRGCNPPANDRFCPDDPVTRGEMAAFLVRAFGLSQANHPGFDDVSGSDTFARDITKLATAGITKGCNPPSNSNYCPDDSVTRGQMTAFLHRAEG